MANIQGTEGSDVLTGSDGQDYIYGLGGDDLIDGLFGQDFLYGGDGNDTFRFSGIRYSSGETLLGLMDGGSGYDTIDFTGVSPVVVGTIQNAIGNFALGAYIGSQKFEITGVEAIRLGSGNDYFGASSVVSQPLSVWMGGGNDEISSGPYASIYGEDGNDIFFVSGSFGTVPTHSVLSGGDGFDTLKTNILFSIDLAAGTATSGNASFTVSGFEVLLAAASSADYATSFYGDETANIFAVNSIFEGEAPLTYYGRGGDDQLTTSAGVDYLDGGDGNDRLNAGAGNDTLLGGLGDDMLNGGDGVDTASYTNATAGVVASLLLQGQAQNTFGDGFDTLTGIEGLTGSRFADTLTGDNGVNLIAGGDGNDIVTAQGGDDLVFGGNGDDVLYGNVGKDRLNGDAGNDVLYGGQGDDVLGGGLGNDYLEGGKGINYLYGEGGSDTAGYSAAATGVTVSLLQQSVAGSADVAQETGVGTDYLHDIANLTGSANADVLTGDNTANILIGGAGNDVLTGLLGNDTLSGDDGDDILYGNQGNDTLNGGMGADTLYGGQNDDVLYGNQGNDTLVGGLGNDTLYGGQNDDVLNGGDGNDMLVGGLGVNVLTGGAGADTFSMNAQGRDSIMDFDQASGDRIDLRAVGFAGASQLTVTQASGTNHYVIEGNTNGDDIADFYLDVFGAMTAPNSDAFIFA